MRVLLFFLIASCLSLLSSGAAAAWRAEEARAASPLRAGPLVCSMASVAAAAAVAMQAVLADGGAEAQADADADAGPIVAPGDDGLQAEDVAEAPKPPGYCNIWSADLLDPPDVLDEIEESSALIAVPTVPLELHASEVAEVRHGSAPPLVAAVFKPPISLL